MIFKRPSLPKPPKLSALPCPSLALLARPLALLPLSLQARLLEPVLNQLLATPIEEGEFDLL